jgi:hypothetical protein
MILFFDTFITNSFFANPLENNERYKTLDLIRSKKNNYKFQEKIDVVKYTLISYSNIDWEDVIIKYECEDNLKKLEFYNFCKELFPTSKIFQNRSDTAEKYLNALREIKGNPWVFFSPNNDHVNLVNNSNYVSIVQDAEFAEKKFPNYNITIPYSHFSENLNSISFKNSLWGYYNRNFRKKVYETISSVFVKNSKFIGDSIKIFRLNLLLYLFKNQDKKKIIRIEDTSNYLSRSIKEISIISKKELCRHYDGYPISFIDPPPLFIPPGFFQKSIKIKYMFDKYDSEYVNINPKGEYIFDNGNCDLKILLGQIPFFWKSRIINIKKNEQKKNGIYSKIMLNYYKNLYNPWNRIPTFFNIILSIFRILYLTKIANKICDLSTYKIK